MKVLFTYNYGEKEMKAVADLGYELVYIKEKELSDAEEISDVDIIVGYNPFNKIDISNLKNLKWIQLTSIGIDQLPKQKVKENGIIVTNNNSCYSIPIGEWIVMKILELLKNSKEFYRKQSDREWKVDSTIIELYNKTICFIGTGSIASEAAKRLIGFDVNIIGINTSGKSKEYFNSCYPIQQMDYVLSQADIVVVSIPYTKETHHLINENNIYSIKKGARLINISRGSIIKESALVEALKAGRIHGAALDVFEEEPLPKDNPLWELDNIIITPHNSWVSEMRNHRTFNIVYDNLRRFIAGENLKNIVDIDRGY